MLSVLVHNCSGIEPARAFEENQHTQDLLQRCKACGIQGWRQRVKRWIQMSGSAPNPPLSSGRRFQRYPLDIRISIQVFREGETISLWGRSSELGEDGIGGTITAELEPGEVVSMELSLPLTPYPIKCRALVRYRDGLRHGFEFLALSPKQREAIHKLCQALPPAS